METAAASGAGRLAQLNQARACGDQTERAQRAVGFATTRTVRPGTPATGVETLETMTEIGDGTAAQTATVMQTGTAAPGHRAAAAAARIGIARAAGAAAWATCSGARRPARAASTG